MNAKLSTHLRVLAIAALACSPALSAAEDIDIFGRPPAANSLPNVLLVWDSSANWSSNIAVPDCYFVDDGVQTTEGPKFNAPDKEQGKKFAIEKCALYNVIDALQPKLASDPPRFNIGLMMFNESGAPQGGYPRKQFLPLTRANAALLKTAIKNIAINVDKANNGPYAQTLYEAYLMYAKKTPLNGTLGTKWDPAAVYGGKYVGAPGNGCGTNHVIFVSNGSPNENNTDALGLLANAGGDTTLFTYPPGEVTNSDQNNWADEFARFLRNADVSDMEGTQSIVTHAVAVIGASSDGLYPNFIKGIATQGGGHYRATANVTELTRFLLNVFNSIEAANSAFASASLPISVNAQGTFKNQVFVGMFRPDALARPRWYGNLKQYQIIYDSVTDSLQLGDRFGAPAISGTSGFFDAGITSFWTENSTFWANDPKGTPKTASDAPDGEVVEKGGVAQHLRTTYATDQSTRRVFTCIGCAGGTDLAAYSATQFEVSNSTITAAMLGLSGSGADAERDAIIEWVRGNDNRGDELGPGGTTTVRPSVHGDVLHSRPAVVDYGGTIGTVVFYGSNDGMLRAVDGDREAGQELWAFVAAEHLTRFKRLRDNTPEIKFPVTPPLAVTLPRDYLVDGSITVYQKLNADRQTERAIIYVTMRRGGRFMYAFDVTAPSNPVMLWRKSNADIPVLGQTWSEARLAMVKGRTNPVLVMGAGYDAAAEDATSPGAATMGKGVVVLDAFDGSLVKTFATERPVPASVGLLDSDFDGYTDRVYAVDLGANVYRIDFENVLGDGATTNWKIQKFASLGDSAMSRKFFHAPDIVATRTFTAVLVGSGDREKPLAPLYPPSSVTNDRFYTLFDYVLGKGGSVPLIYESQLVSSGPGFPQPPTVPGCYTSLNSSLGEKVVTSAVSVGGWTYFSTNTPTDPFSPTSCKTDLGIAKSKRLKMFCDEEQSQEFIGGGLPPNPVVGLVEITIPENSGNGQGEETKQVPFIIGGFNAQLSGLQASKVPIAVDPTRRRTYWFTNKGH